MTTASALRPSMFDRPAGTLALAGINGLLWGVVVSILIGAGLALVTGLALRPQLGTFALAGLVGAAVHAGLRADALGWRSPQSLAPLVAILLVSLALSGLQPFNLGIGEAPLAWLASLLLTALGLHWVILASQHPIRFGRMNRFRREQALMLSLRAFGFVFFGVIVVLPLYVLVMTSLKTQQALLANPLDLWPDFDQGLMTPLRSYIELFRDFDFGRYMWLSLIHI